MFLSLLAGIGLGAGYFGHKHVLAMDLRNMRNRKRKKSLRRYQHRALRDAKRQLGAHDAFYKHPLRVGDFLYGMLARDCFDRVAGIAAEHVPTPSGSTESE
jgi:hypothetical protein